MGTLGVRSRTISIVLAVMLLGFEGGCRAAFDVVIDGDLGVADAMTVPSRCGEMATVADDFQGTTVRSIWDAPGAGISQQDGVITITPPATAGLRGLSGAAFYDLTGSAVSIEVVQVANAGTRTTLQLLTNQRDTNGNPKTISMSESNGALSFYIDSEVGNLPGPPFDAVLHRVWRIRESAGLIYFETSPDATTWVARASAASPDFITEVQVHLDAENLAPNPTPGSAQFAKFNGGTAVGQMCKANTLKDPFTQPTFLWGWPQLGACTLSITQGQASFTLPASTSTHCELESGSLYDMTESTLVVAAAVVPPAQASSAYALMRLTSPDSKGQIDLRYQSGRLYFETILNGTRNIYNSVPFDASMAWWRLREEAGTLFWETAPDGLAWAQQASIADPFALAGVFIAVGAGTASETMASSAGFLGLNSMP